MMTDALDAVGVHACLRVRCSTCLGLLGSHLIIPLVKRLRCRYELVMKDEDGCVAERGGDVSGTLRKK
jgi:hypothetical protein